MAYATREARQHLLDTVAEAIAELQIAVAALGAAYEQLDDQSADRMEDALFRPAQTALGRAKRTHTGFAARHGLEARQVAEQTTGVPPSAGARGNLDRAAETVAEAELILAELQDSMMPVEVGDAELRAGLADVRATIAPLDGAAHEFMRTLGR
jgi:hypothetical protein